MGGWVLSTYENKNMEEGDKPLGGRKLVEMHHRECTFGRACVLA